MLRNSKFLCSRNLEIRFKNEEMNFQANTLIFSYHKYENDYTNVVLFTDL